MTRFCLVRHGAYGLLDRALGGRADHPLNEAGRAQARACGRALAGCVPGVAALVASPVARAAETAAIIGAVAGLSVVADEAFSEIDFAAWSGKAFAALAEDPAWQAWNEARGSARVPGGESMVEVQARAVAGLERLAVEWPEGTVVIVSHADVIKAMVAHVLGLDLAGLLRFEISAGSISWLNWATSQVLSVNAHPPPTK